MRKLMPFNRAAKRCFALFTEVKTLGKQILNTNAKSLLKVEVF